MENRITKAMVLKVVADYFTENEIEIDGVTSADIITYANTTIEQIEAKKVKAREKAAEKKSAGDALTEATYDALSDEFEIIADIAARVDAEDASVAKVTYRLNALVEAGKAEKTDVKVEKRTVKAYKRITE